MVLNCRRYRTLRTHSKNHPHRRSNSRSLLRLYRSKPTQFPNSTTTHHCPHQHQQQRLVLLLLLVKNQQQPSESWTMTKPSLSLLRVGESEEAEEAESRGRGNTILELRTLATSVVLQILLVSAGRKDNCLAIGGCIETRKKRRREGKGEKGRKGREGKGRKWEGTKRR